MANKTVAVPKDVNKAVKSEIYDALREGLTRPSSSSSKKSWAQDFVQKMLSEAKKNPNGALGQMIAKQIMQEDILTSLDDATDKYLSRDLDFNEYRIMKTLYPEQQEVFNNHFDSRIICIGSRRIGKSELAARLALRDSLNPGHCCIYINLKFENAISQCYDKALPLAESLGLQITKASKNDGRIEFSNGSTILFKGNNNKSAADTFLGGAYSLAIIDEVQTECNLQYLIDTVLAPTIDRDFDNGQIICLGTPPRIPHTYCERIWKELKGWKHYGWDMTRNPFLKGDTEAIIKKICEEKGCKPDAPFIAREYRGQWQYDEESRVVRDPKIYEGGIDYIKGQIQSGNLHFDYVYGGVDFGFAAYNAIVTIGWDSKRGIGYIIDSFKFNKATVTEIVEKAKISLANCQELLIMCGTDPHNIQYYGDNSDKSIIFELSVEYNFPIVCAYKHDKAGALSVLAELFRRKIFTDKDSSLYDEYEMTVYKRDEATDAILPELDDDIYHPDALMAALYASRSLVQDFNPIGNEDKANMDSAALPEPAKDEESYTMPDGSYRFDN